MEGLVSLTTRDKDRIERLAQKHGITFEQAADLAAAAGVDLFFKDPAAHPLAKIIVIDKGSPNESAP